MYSKNVQRSMNTMCTEFNASMLQCRHYTVAFPNMVSMQIIHYHNVLLWINPTRCQEETVGFRVTVVRSLMHGLNN